MKPFARIKEVFFFDAAFLPSRATVKPRVFSSFSFRKSGSVSVFTDRETLTSDRGSVTYIPAGCGYTTEITAAGEMYVMHFVTEDGAPPFGDRPQVATPDDGQSYINLFQRAQRHACAEDGYACMADAYRLLSLGQSLFFANRYPPNERMMACKNYLDTHVTQPTLRVSALAAMYFTSEVQFRADFRRAYGTSPSTYIKARRIEIAKALLESNLYSVAEVALRSGFDSISYFSSEFRRATGFSPREYCMR